MEDAVRPGLPRPTCGECGKPRERCRATVRHMDGTIGVVCPQCWRRLDYDTFMKEARLSRA